MDRETLRMQLKSIFVEDTGKDIPALSDDVALRDGLGLDSLDVVSLVMQIEQCFRIRLVHEELSSVVTAGQLIDLVHAKIRAAAAQPAAVAHGPALRKAA